MVKRKSNDIFVMREIMKSKEHCKEIKYCENNPWCGAFEFGSVIFIVLQLFEDKSE